MNELVGNIRQAVTAQHDRLYATVLVKTGSIPRLRVVRFSAMPVGLVSKRKFECRGLSENSGS